ncbi:E3 ubiquitin-protein ligase RNF4 [Aplochiton taeniatus]
MYVLAKTQKEKSATPPYLGFVSGIATRDPKEKTDSHPVQLQTYRQKQPRTQYEQHTEYCTSNPCSSPARHHRCEEEVVDLTCEGSEPAAVVDLTNNDSVVLVDEGPQSRRGTESYVLSSDEEEDTNTILNAALLSSLQASSRARSTPGTVSCPVCMDAYAEIIESGRLVVSTKCGHLFCSQCLRDSLTRSHTCPTCRKKLTCKQYHPIYI